MPVFSGTAANDTLVGTEGDDTIFGLGGNDTLSGGLGADMLDGGDGNDFLRGNTQLAFFTDVNDGVRDILSGGAGSDQAMVQFGDNADGGLGTDTLMVSLADRPAGVTLLLDVDPNGRIGLATGSTIAGFEIFQIYATKFDDQLVGTGGNDTLHGDAGADFLNGGGGADILYANDSTIEVGGTIFLSGSADDGVVDTLHGGEGNDICHVALGDHAFGGGGIDALRATFRGSLNGVTLDLASGELNAVMSAALGSTIDGFEQLTLVSGSNFADVLSGAATNDALYGGLGDDILTGRVGDDTLGGDGGADRLEGGDGADALYGGAGDDTLLGGAGDDQLHAVYSASPIDGAAVASDDVIDGGDGVDILYMAYNYTLGGVSNPGVIANLTIDLALTTRQDIGFGHLTISNVENLYVGNGDDRVYGTDGANQLTGWVGDDILHGRGGHDVLFGQDGADELWGGDGSDLLDGGADDDVLQGGDGDDYLIGGAGDDILYGGAGNTGIFRGGAGADIFYGEGRSDQADYFNGQTGLSGVIVNLAGNTALDDSGSTDVLIGIEHVMGTNLADQITGDAQDNHLVGYDGDDTLFGGAGADMLSGDLGNDILVGNADPFARDLDYLSGGFGDDILYAEASDFVDGSAGFDRLIAVNAYNFVLDMAATSIEYAVLDFGNDVVTAVNASNGISVFASGGNDRVTGWIYNDLIFGGVGDDVLTGDSGADSLVGEAGVDSLSGGDGDDRIYFDAQDSFISGGAGYDAGYITPGTGAGVSIDLGAASLEFIQDLAGADDVILGSTLTQGFSAYAGAGADTIDGSAFADVIWGEAGDDVVNAGAGSDIVVGGAGSDRIRGGAGNDSLYGGASDGVRDTFLFEHAGAANADAIYEFVLGEDRIDLSAFGATFAGVSISSAGGSSVVLLNGQHICTVVGVVGLTAGDFIFSAGGAPADPGDGAFKADMAQVQPGLATEVFGDTPAIASPASEGSPPAEIHAFWLPTPDHSGWLTMLV